MDFDAEDKAFSMHVVVLDYNGTRFYLSACGSAVTYTDRLPLATIFRWRDEAEKSAARENADPDALKGWRPMLYAQAYAEHYR